MINHSTNDIIVALSTPPGTSAIGVIRLTGKGCIAFIDNFFSQSLQNKPSHTIHFGLLGSSDNTIDECLIAIFRAPRSYTKEDVVEISCHGSPYILDSALQFCIKNGARMANKGEFTLRAFLNGQLDLAQAEAVADIISSDSRLSHSMALKQLRGGFSNKIVELREALISFASLIELELDFGEEDVTFANRIDLQKTISTLKPVLLNLIKSFELGNSLKSGIPTVIAGKPNAGKSTLLNALLNENRAIVSDIPGTTRDIIEDYLIIDGIKFILNDTAGLRETSDEIEKIGVSKTKDKLSKAQLILYVIDVTETTPQQAADEIMSFRSSDNIILLLNKMDLYPTLDIESYNNKSDQLRVIPISALNKMNTDYLKETMRSFVNDQNSQDVSLVNNIRHFEALQKTLDAIDATETALQNNVTGDFLAMDLRQALHHLGLITGEIHTDDLLENIFSKFCIGK